MPRLKTIPPLPGLNVHAFPNLPRASGASHEFIDLDGTRSNPASFEHAVATSKSQTNGLQAATMGTSRLSLRHAGNNGASLTCELLFGAFAERLAMYCPAKGALA